MKRYIILTLALVMSVYTGNSQEIKEVDIKDYTIELKRESSADYLGHQVTKPENGIFSLRAVLDFVGNTLGFTVCNITKT